VYLVSDRPVSLLSDVYLRTYPELSPIGAEFSVSTHAEGGVLPISFMYNNLPRDCAGEAAENLNCTSDFSGEYSIGSLVSDASGDHVRAGAVEWISTTSEVTVIETGLPYGTVWYLNVSDGPSYSSNTSELQFASNNGVYGYTLASENASFGPFPSQGSFTVENAPVGLTVTFGRVYPVVFAESGLWNGTSWSVITDGRLLQSTLPSMSLSLPNGSYTYSIPSLHGWTSSTNQGNYTLNGSGAAVPVAFHRFLFTVTFHGNGTLIYPPWTLYFNSTMWRNLLMTVQTEVPNGTYGYLAMGPSTYDVVGMPPYGAVTVHGMNVTLNFSLVPGPTNSLEVDPRGLYGNAQMCIQIGDTFCTSSWLFFQNLTPAIYPYEVLPVPGFHISPTHGNFDVRRHGVTAIVGFAAISYPLVFTEHGLRASTRWSVKLTPWGAFYTITKFGQGPRITFHVPDGTYNYSIPGVSGYYGISGGEVIVNAGGAVALSFRPVTYSITFVETGLPTGTWWSVHVGGWILSGTGSNMSFELRNGTYAFRIATIPGYSSSAAPNPVRVTGGSATVTVTFRPR
jgi:hypothetical protein